MGSSTSSQQRAIGFRWIPQLLRWLIFSLAISVLPFGFKAFCYIYLSKAISLDALFGNGELFLITCAIAAETIGQLLGSTKRTQVDSRWLFLSGGCFLFSIIATFGYGIASIGPLIASTTITINSDAIVGTSILFFLGTCAAAVYTKINVPDHTSLSEP